MIENKLKLVLTLLDEVEEKIGFWEEDESVDTLKEDIGNLDLLIQFYETCSDKIFDLRNKRREWNQTWKYNVARKMTSEERVNFAIKQIGRCRAVDWHSVRITYALKDEREWRNVIEGCKREYL